MRGLIGNKLDPTNKKKSPFISNMVSTVQLYQKQKGFQKKSVCLHNHMSGFFGNHNGRGIGITAY